MDARALLAWFAANARPLPWRTPRRDPYAAWVSEAMLQQTRVETVLRYYERFLKAFPDVTALAQSDESRVMKAWEGLGYYRRARLLHAGARAVVDLHGGIVPGTLDELRALPGMGPYTAGAVGSLAFGLAAPAVDGNVLRVFARQSGTRVASRAAAEAWVMRHQPVEAPGAFNEALMELGATVCSPRAPRCDSCPLAASCSTKSDAVPARAPKRKARSMRVALAFVERDGRVLLERRSSGLLAGTWGLPWVEGGRAELAAHVEAIVGAPVDVGAHAAATGKHVFTHRSWAMRAFRVSTSGARGEWRRPDDVALGSAHRKMLALLLEP